MAYERLYQTDLVVDFRPEDRSRLYQAATVVDFRTTDRAQLYQIALVVDFRPASYNARNSSLWPMERLGPCGQPLGGILQSRRGLM